MTNQQTLQGNWNEIIGQIKCRWGQLTSDDLQQAQGNLDQLVELIQRKTGEARSSIEEFLEGLTSNGASGLNQAAQTAREYAHKTMESVQHGTQQVAETFRRGYDQAAGSMQQGYEQAEEMIRQRPGESAAVCFGIGMVVGVLLGLTLRGR